MSLAHLRSRLGMLGAMALTGSCVHVASGQRLSAGTMTQMHPVSGPTVSMCRDCLFGHTPTHSEGT